MSGLVVEKNPRSPVSEAYRTLRTNIQFASFDRDIQIILVTSSGPGEGKSTTSANLALTIAQAGKSVLLIDCDLRRPNLHRKFRLSNAVGLSNLLVEDLEPVQALQMYMDKLYILTSGTIPPNPAEMLASRKMKSFLEMMRREFDYIILDTPPVNAVTDAQLLSTMADGVLLVISSGEAEREAADRAKDLLNRVNANILGVVLNKVDISSRRGYGYYYYGDANERRRKR
ncbi:CpsD/CapB family tyrosine-protein kinase [Fonticella tunisiensis]|uniref:non-specific protein-tyrosine kinase n=1 Tax=Fonticella tunisiensis TaxID=1096341 RepID=A0A4V3ERS2_9CLOT|nr:CpsD/CapB family tyrosine-protein kinase [Fonticella tunisiensis]TDT46093.1 capsular exopolysaccharide synthesis family protein [Fonticella tunisiensis]